MLLFTFLFSLFSQNPQPQTVDSVLIIKQITIVGNQRTKESIILRELDIAIGDSIKSDEIEKRLDLNRRKLVNTNLFVTIELKSTKVSDNQVVIDIKLLEQWYVLGYPVFQIVDRNYAEWWQRGADFSRTTYGIDFLHNNFRGRAEKLGLRIESGFTQRIDFGYRIPYIDKSQKTGLGFSLSYITNKNMAFRSINDTLNYFKSPSEDVLRKRFSAAVNIRKRIGFYDTHTLELRYNNSTIADTISKLNPDYFLDKRTNQKYFQLSYYFNYDFRDNVAYPLRGKRFEFGISKSGLLGSDDINQVDMAANYYWFKPLTRTLFYGLIVKGKISFPEKQPFYNTRGLGYGGDLVRGYELYVVDGTSYFLVRNNLKFELLNTKIHLKFLKVKQFNTIPFGIYPNVFFDYGYSNNPFATENKTKLANRMLYGGGAGLDFVTYYNLVVRFSYVINDRQQRNFVFGIGREF
jgi:outer membrane protein assembly factor BamA